MLLNWMYSPVYWYRVLTVFLSSSPLVIPFSSANLSTYASPWEKEGEREEFATREPVVVMRYHWVVTVYGGRYHLVE